MLSSYFKIAWRNLFKNSVHSLINLSGLALGMAAAILLLMNIQWELSVDQFHEKKATLYEVYNRGIINNGIACYNETSAPLGAALKNYPEIRNVARWRGSEMLFRYADRKIAANGNFTDIAFLSMFSFPLIEGNAHTALNNPNNILVTRRLASRIFGDQEPMGKIINTPTGDHFIITGILKDPPVNTQFNFEYLLPMSYLQNPGTWKNQNLATYVELAPGANLKAVNKKIAQVIIQHNPGEPGLAGHTIFLYPFTKVYLEGRFENGEPAGGMIDNLKMLGGLAAIILLIACINFMNLSTARSEKRAKEVGIRKVAGAVRRSLIFQFISESILMAFLAGVVALVLAQLVLPAFIALTGAKLSMPWASPQFWLAALAFIFFTGLLAGSYPAFYLSSFRPIKVLKGALQNTNALVTPRKLLVIVQFVCSIFLINFTVVYQKQIRHTLDRELGFAKDYLVFHLMTSDLQRNYTVIKNELIGSGAALSVSEASTSVTRGGWNESGLKWQGMDPHSNTAFTLIMENGGFVRTNGLSLIDGRDIDMEHYAGDTLSCVINETSAKVLGFKYPVGQIILDQAERWKIVGVVKDFLIGDPNEATEPLLIKGAVNPGMLNIRLSRSRPFLQNVRQTEAILKKYNPGYITDLQFADSDYAGKFQETKNAALLINAFTFIAIFVSCMGLLGLAIYTTGNRTREIGIRKVLGASTKGIVSLLTGDFVRLILISIVIASPLAWLFINSFLDRFSYRAPINAWILAVSGAAALLLALTTIAIQTIHAATANPVKSLRAE